MCVLCVSASVSIAVAVGMFVFLVWAHNLSFVAVLCLTPNADSLSFLLRTSAYSNLYTCGKGDTIEWVKYVYS